MKTGYTSKHQCGFDIDLDLPFADIVVIGSALISSARFLAFADHTQMACEH